MKPVNVGICGLGTVGYGSYCVLKNNRSEIARRVGREVVVSRIATRKLRSGQDIGNTPLGRDIFAVASDPGVDVVLELLGGFEPARELVLRAIENGKHVVTANKALIAVHGNEIFAAAEEKQVVVAYEASVAGGIPIVKAIREGMAGNHIRWLAGIINGTGNFILTQMQDQGRDFQKALQEAQQLGYAEADPSFDVEGIDAAHKLTILASIAFGVPLRFERAYTEGISAVTPQDITYADELGYHIKHLGITRRTPRGIELRVHPTLISKENLLADVDGVGNAVMVHGDPVGSTLYYGAGAGAAATASAVVADIVDVARVIFSPQSRVPALAFQEGSLADFPVLDMDHVVSAYYLRISALDKIGVLAHITEILGRNEINIEAIIQKEPRHHDGDEDIIVPVIILTHEVPEVVMNTAITDIEALDSVVKKVTRIRVDKLGEF